MLLALIITLGLAGLIFVIYAESDDYFHSNNNFTKDTDSND